MTHAPLRILVAMAPLLLTGCLFLESPSTPSNNTTNNQPNNTNNQPNNEPCSDVARPGPPECNGNTLVTYAFDEVTCTLTETQEDCSEFGGTCVAGECQTEPLCADDFLVEGACQQGLAYFDEGGFCVVGDCAATGGVCEDDFCTQCQSWTNDSCGTCDDGAAPAPCAGDEGEECIKDVGCVPKTCELGLGMPGRFCGVGLRCHLTKDVGCGYCAPPCVTDEECEGGFRCTKSGAVLGLCVECVQNQDCDGGAICDKGICL